MARQFVSASSQFLEVDIAAATVVPITMSAWLFSDGSAGGALIGLADKDSAGDRFLLTGNQGAGDNEVSAFSIGAPGNGEALSGNTHSNGAWHHAAARFETSTSRYAFLNGVKGTQNTADSTPANEDRTSIGRSGDSTPGFHWNGRIAEAAMWTVSLTDAEIAWLAAGYSPLTLTHRIGSLVLYKDLIRDINRPGIGPTLVNTGTTVETHTRAHYPVAPYIVTAPAAIVGYPAAYYDHSQHVSDAMLVG